MKLTDNYEYKYPTKIIWENQTFKNVWNEKIFRASKFNSKIEVLSVLYNLRPSALLYCHASNFSQQINEWEKAGLIFKVVAKEKMAKGYSHTVNFNKMNGDWFFRGILTKNKNLSEELATAFKNSEDHRIGEFLGYPEDCIDFFNEIWEEGYVDPIWQQAQNTKLKTINEKNFIKIDKAKINNLMNPLLKYIGVEGLIHMPCSFDCEESLKFAESYADIAETLQIDGYKEMQELLSLPLKWYVSDGLALITSPYFKIISQSVYCEGEYVVEI